MKYSELKANLQSLGFKYGEMKTNLQSLGFKYSEMKSRKQISNHWGSNCQIQGSYLEEVGMETEVLVIYDELGRIPYICTNKAANFKEYLQTSFMTSLFK